MGCVGQYDSEIMNIITNHLLEALSSDQSPVLYAIYPTGHMCDSLFVKLAVAHTGHLYN